MKKINYFDTPQQRRSGNLGVEILINLVRPSDEKDQEHIMDVSEDGPSDCCSAAVYHLGDSYICKDCKEYCEVLKVND